MSNVLTQNPHQAVLRHNLRGLRICAWGGLPTLSGEAGQKCIRHNLDRTGKRLKDTLDLLIKPPAPLVVPQELAHQRRIITITSADDVQTVTANGFIVADAALVHATYPARIAMQSRDCPVIVLSNPLTGAVALVHGMRDLLLGTPDGEPDLLTKTTLLLAPSVEQRRALNVFISVGISAEYYALDQRPDLQDRFLQRFDNVFTCTTRWTLDLGLVIKGILCDELGVPKTQVGRTKLCTFADKRLGSYRGDRPGQNVTGVVRTSIRK